MWVFTTAGFVSAVEHRKNHDLVMVRARDEESLKNMLTSIELAGKALAEDGSDVEVDKDLKIETSAKGDYRHRVTCSKSTFALFLQFEVLNYLSYPNFKSELAKFRGTDFTSAAHSVWSVMHRVSDGPQVYNSVGKGGTRLHSKYPAPKGKGGSESATSFVGSTFFNEGDIDEDWNRGYHTFGPGEGESDLTEPMYKEQFEEAEAAFDVLPEGSEDWTDAEWEEHLEKLAPSNKDVMVETFLEPAVAAAPAAAEVAKTATPKPKAAAKGKTT